MTYISRKLEVTQESGKTVEYGDAEFFVLQAPLIILGEPGAGKSELVREFAAKSGSQVYRASALPLFEFIAPASLPARIVIDGLDEVTAYTPGTPIVQVLEKLANHHHPNFVLTCRAVDWQHAANSAIIAGRWQHPPIVGHLLPLSDKEVVDFITANGGGQDGETFLKEAQKRDVADLLRNPQNLIMLLKTVQTYGWPATKSELFAKACLALIEEDNGLHRSLNRIRPAADVLLQAAGFVCAQLLLSGTGSTGIDGGNVENVPKSAEFVSEDFDTATIRHALATKVFRPAGRDAVEPCHRTMAEYLAAKWLSGALCKKLSLKRLERLLYGNDYIVPSALRGLHAWLGTLSPGIAKTLIARDPYGFFRYGDPSLLSVEQSKHLLQSLEKLADVDPYFRSEDWHATFGRGLAKAGLRDDIIRVIRNPETPYQLSHLIVESIQGDAFADSIANDLLSLVLDVSATPVERNAAVDALAGCKAQPNWPETVEKLRNIGDVESLRIALDIVQERVEMFSGTIIAETLIGIAEAMAAEDGPNYAGLGYGIHQKMSLNQLEEALQVLSENVPTEETVGRRRGHGEAEEWIYRFVQERFERGSLPPASRVWSWLKHSERHSYHRSEWDKYSGEYFSQHSEYRLSIQAEAINAAPDAEALWMTLWHIGDASPGLWLRENDLIFHMDALLKDRKKYADWAKRWRHLVQWGKMHRDFTGAALDHARSQAAQHSALQEHLTDLERPPERDYEKESQKQQRQREQRQSKKTHKRHEEFHKIQNQLATGQRIDVLYTVASSYLGRYSDIRGETPTGRVAHLTGEDLAPLALEGIAAAAAREDIPTARQMVELRVNESKHYFFEPVLLAHCAILADSGRSLEELPLPAAASALAACQWGVHFIGDDVTPDIQKQLESIVFADQHSKETFLRDTLEPYLATGSEHVSGLYRLARSEEFEDVAGALALEWLKRFTKLSNSSLKDLMRAAIRYMPHNEVVKLVREKIGNKTWENEDQRGIWMGAAFLLDYDNCRDMLAPYADENKAHLWPIREMAFPDREQGGFWPQLTPAQNHFLIIRFGPAWPPAEHPSSGWCGDQNPWDASQFIAARINALAADLSDQAATLLRGLVNDEGLKGYQNQIKHVLVQQARRHAEEHKNTPSLSGVRSVLLQGEPISIDDLQALVVDELELLQRRLKDGPTNGVLPFWNGDKPQDENYCRDRIVEHLTPYLEQKFKVRPHTEGTMPDSNRCDFLNTSGALDLPVEVKGQWHREVWTAALNQLQNYTREYRAQGRGIYLVLWFGTIPRKNPPRIHGKQSPQTAQEMESLLREQMEGKLSNFTRIFVLDVSRQSS